MFRLGHEIKLDRGSVCKSGRCGVMRKRKRVILNLTQFTVGFPQDLTFKRNQKQLNISLEDVREFLR